MTVEIASRQGKVRVPRKRIAVVVDALLASHDLGGAMVSVAVVDNSEIRRVNRKFLGRNRVTDVIAFPLADGVGAPGDEEPIGEVVVSAERAKQAAAGPVQSELLLYVVHGVLHLLGWDDDTPERRERMHNEALRILRRHSVRGVT